MAYLVEEHVGYVADEQRMNAYRMAIRALVRPGAVVVDLGSGSGILGLLACEAGAARVYCIDSSSMLGVARKHITDSGYADRCIFLNAHSEEVKLPEQADLVVADQMGPFALWAGILECFVDARRRFLKPSGVLVPNRLSLWLAGVADSSFRDRVSAIERNAGALDLSHLRHLMLNARQTLDPRVTRQAILTNSGELVRFTLGAEAPDKVTASVDLTATAAGTLDGLAGWFSASLDAGADTEITNAPLSPTRIDRNYLFLPFEAALEVLEGDVFRVTLTTLSRSAFLAWHVQKVDASGNKVSLIKQTSLSSNLLSRQHVLQTQIGQRPALNRRGLVKRYILELCDEQRTIDQITSAVHERFGDDFQSRERVTELVAATLSNLTQ